MVILKHVLVATDFGEPAATALAYGKDLSRQYTATLHVLHVADDVTARYATEIPMFTADEQAQLEQSARARVEALLTAEDRRQLNARAVVRSSLSPAAAICDYAKTSRIDLIIMGTHGRSGMAHFLMGSVAERIVRTAPCPVLTVRCPEREFIAPDALTTVSQA